MSTTRSRSKSAAGWPAANNSRCGASWNGASLAVTVITHAFDALARSEKEAFGAPDHPVLVVQHPIGTVKLDDVNKRAEAAFDKLVEILVEPERKKAALG